MGEKITRELLKKRAEHNEGELSTLREITLHQFDIEKIENLDVYCRHLEILYLQNNQILKIENLQKLKQLQYLQLAINNITKIENLQGCESLEKLDLTLNFISNPLDVECLKDLEFLRELYLVGNPCTEKQGYREYIVTTLPQLTRLDGIEIEKSERILARQLYSEIRSRFVNELGEPVFSPEEPLSSSDDTQDLENLSREEILERKRQDFQTKPISHTPESRLQAARDLEEFKPTKDPKPSKKKAQEENYFGPDGRVLQKNQGKWEFKFSTTTKTLILDIEISKFIDTSLMDVQVHSSGSLDKQDWIRVTVKDKILQLLLDEKVCQRNVICERSKLTGHLVISMLLLKYASETDKVPIQEICHQERKKMQELQTSKELQVELEKKEKQVKGESRMRRYERLFEPTDAVNIHDILLQTKLKPKKDQKGIAIVPISRNEIKIQDEEFIDDPDVPPLC